MKNKSTSKYITLILTCCMTVCLYAQKKNMNNDFSLSIAKYSEKPNFEKEHIHVIELKNKSKVSSSYTISAKNNKCSKKHDNTLSKSIGKKHSELITEIYLNSLNNKQQISNRISLGPNESAKIYLKTKKADNMEMDSRHCTKLYASKLSPAKSINGKSGITKSVTIETFVRNPNNKGH